MADQANTRRLLTSDRTPGMAQDLYEAKEIVDLFADGYGRVISGPAVTKMEFFRVVGVKSEGALLVEEREVFLRLTVPTAALFEHAGNMVAGMSENLPALMAASEQARTTILKAVQAAKDAKL
ncbi:hypothetical protein M2222_008320 [Bradyrhizobium elkanii]|uniref:hypothetical protein n=1 Tax=Bradyrhizobium elkanii TaxID=29448 RepID=UPI00216845B5|nr:hypothetical protein [Bradyrhizobium elkanii]MCS3451903.1 hypothetical protein [Bradyrhizobium elkanii]MCS3565998.1 hypothetical protein [Bradyrhizobium elkanii]MCW2153272.1 hypothetical protein [Bradyrhizobium elkanii]MCW2377005.1 hypothetical protein [Bradyrhizobium elkanii]